MAQLEATFDSLQQFAGSLNPNFDYGEMFDLIEMYLASKTKENFDYGRSPDGTPWEPLTWPRLSGKAGNPLHDTGVMRESVTAKGSPFNISQRTSDSLEWGTRWPYARTHQNEKKDGKVIRPKRGKFLAIPLTQAARLAGSPRNMSGLHWRVGSKSGYAFTQQGTRAVNQFLLLTEVRIPNREFLGLNDDMIDDIADIIVRCWTKSKGLTP